jgi:hypothetical protein
MKSSGKRIAQTTRGLWSRGLIQGASRLAISLLLSCAFLSGQSSPSQQYELNDSHFHLTNYIQEGADVHDFLKIMGTKVGRVALFGIPLQQEWSYENSGDYAPTYYLQSDAPLYYYSFTDPHIAMAYRSLTKEEQARFDPMITGFNPTDMYAADHIRRVLQTFPGVFSGIGEFTIHAALAEILSDPAFSNVYFDISWDQVAKYIVATPEATTIAADLVNRYPDRFLFGTDEVAPNDQQSYLKVYNEYGPLWKLLSNDASEKVRKGNYERLSFAARPRVRAWEHAHPK